MKEIHRIIIVTLICLAVAAGVLLYVWPSSAKANTPLLVHAGAGIQPPLDELGKAFTKKTGVRVGYSYKGSGCLLPDICVSRKGDLYIPGELYYMDQARDRDLIATHRVVAQMATVLIAQKGNPKRIRSLTDLARRGLRIGLGDPEAIAVGRAARQALVKAGVWEDVQKNIVMSPMNVVELGNAIKLRHLDAAIVWNATAALYGDDITTSLIPEKWRVDSPIPVGVLKFSKQPTAATQFMNFLATPEARKVFLKHGYDMPPQKTSSTTAKERTA